MKDGIEKCKHGWVYPVPLAKKRKRFVAAPMGSMKRKRFSTRRAAHDWLVQMHQREAAVSATGSAAGM